MALPYELILTCIAINEYPTADIDPTTDYAEVVFEKADAEASDDDIMGPGAEDSGDVIRFRITQAQKDDFTVGDDYTFSVTATP